MAILCFKLKNKDKELIKTFLTLYNLFNTPHQLIQHTIFQTLLNKHMRYIACIPVYTVD